MKEGYKKSVFGLIPENWDIVLVNEITKEHKQGYYTKESYVDEGIRLARITDLNNPKIDYSEMPKLNVSEADFNRYKIEKGDFLFARSGAIGTYGIVEKEEFPAIFASYLIRFRFNSNIVNRYFGYFFESQLCSKQLKGITQGNANVNINAGNIKSLKFPFAPLPEQQKIADILSTVDAKIEVIDQQITETRELKKGLMQRLLTKGIGHTEFKDSDLGEIPVDWELKELGSLLKAIKGGGTPSKDITEYWNPEIPWVTVKDFKKLILDDSIDYISKIGLENSAANLIPAWTLIISTRMAVGKAIFVTKDVSINQDLKALFPKENLNKFFLFHWFFANSENILKLASGSTVKGIRLKVLKGLKLVLPPIEEQQKIAKILTSVDDKLEVLSEKKTTYQELKKGLMQQLLTGKVRVTV